MTIKVVYLSGPMTGLPEFNYPAFNKLEADIKALNPSIKVVNPTQTGYQEGWTHRDYLTVDLKLMLDNNIDAVITLDGWEQSRGAKLEVHVAKELGISIISSKYFLAELRGCLFEKPSLITRLDGTIFSLREHDDALREAEYHNWMHQEDTGNTDEPLTVLECTPLEIGFSHSDTDLLNLVSVKRGSLKQKILIRSSEGVVTDLTTRPTFAYFEDSLKIELFGDYSVVSDQVKELEKKALQDNVNPEFVKLSIIEVIPYKPLVDRLLSNELYFKNYVKANEPLKAMGSK